MKTNIIYIVYLTDAHHSRANQDLIAIFSNHNEAIRCCQHDARANNDDLTKEEKEQLKERSQTQGRDNNYLIESYTIDEYFKTK